MVSLRNALENASQVCNEEGDQVQQAIITRNKRGRQPMEQYVVIVHEGSAMYFHQLWNQQSRGGEGDWVAIDALACAHLDELYQTASPEVKAVLDDNWWDPV